MSGQELALVEDDDDLGLTAKQINALERLAELGSEPAQPNPDKPGKMLYHSNPQIRALQLVYEGKFGGAGRGQGRPKPQAPRAAEVLADKIRTESHVKKMYKALDRGLRKDAGPRVNMDAIKLSIDIERGERALQIKEEEHEEFTGEKEDLIVELIAALTDPAAERALEGFAEEESAEEITDALVVEFSGNTDADSNDAVTVRENTIDSREAGDHRTPASTKKIRNNSRVSATDERKGTTGPNSPRKKLGGKVIKRRTTK